MSSLDMIAIDNNSKEMIEVSKQEEIIDCDVITEPSDYKVKVLKSVVAVYFHYNNRMRHDFPFKQGDFSSLMSAKRKAYQLRDNLVSLSEKTNTGYETITANRNRKHELSVRTSFKLSNKPYFKEVFLSDKVSYKQALREVIDYVHEVKGYGKASILTYDYGLKALYDLGYKGHEDDPKIVSELHKIDDKIVDPKTGDVGVIHSIVSKINIIATFEIGEPVRVILNEVLFSNMLENDLDAIVDLENDLVTKKNVMSNADKQNSKDEIDNMTKDMKVMHRHANNNNELRDIRKIKSVLKKSRVVKKLVKINRDK